MKATFVSGSAGQGRVFRPSLLRASLAWLAVLMLLLLPRGEALGVIRDGGIDPANLGKGDWVYYVTACTNQMGGNVPSVSNLTTFMAYEKSQGIRYLVVKAGTGAVDFNGSGSSPQFNATLVNAAHTAGLLIFAYTRSDGADIPGESALATRCFNLGADGFVFDAEAEWETRPANTWITNGPLQAWTLAGMVRTNWPNKFIGYASAAIISYHSTFPNKQFGYFCDATMPMIYHYNWAQRSPSGAINWTDVNWRNWQNECALPANNPTTFAGTTVYWTNSIKPLAPVNHVYGPNPPNAGVSELAPEDVVEFVDYLAADPHCVTAGGYKGASFWRADLHGAQQWANIKAETSGDFPGIVNHIVMDDNRATLAGGWTHVRTFYNGTFYGDGSGVDTNSFGTNYFFKGQGTGAGSATFRPTVVVGGDYNVYQWHVQRTDASASVPFEISYHGGSTTVYANQQTNHGNWSLLGRFSFAPGTDGYVRVTDAVAESGAVAIVDGLKLTFVAPTSVPAAPSGLTASAVSSSQIDLVWSDNATNESTYIVASSATAGGPYTNIAVLPPNSTNYSHTGLAAATTAYYVVWATNYLGASATSAEASANTQSTGAPPTISTQPQGHEVVLGETAAFNVVATGSPPLAFQWRFNGADISGATDSSYTRANVLGADAGDYSVWVTNGYGSVLSSNATLIVDTNVTLPVITSQPQSQTVVSGQSATFTVTATNKAAMRYQWRLNAAPILGATGSAYTVANAQTQNAGSYSVVITNVVGATTSADAVLTVNFSLSATATAGGAVSKSPDQANYAPNAVVTLTANANTGYAFTGWSGDASGTINPLSVTMTANKTISATFGSTGTEIVIDNSDPGWSNTSPGGAAWIVGSIATVPKVGANYLYKTGTGASSITHSCRWTPEIAVAGLYDVYVFYQIGANRTIGATYNVFYNGGSVSSLQNQYSTTPNQGGWFLIGSNLPFAAGMGGYVELGNNTPDTLAVSADAAKFVFVAPVTPPEITDQPQGQTVGAGQDATFSVGANGTAPLHYQWRFNSAGIPGATTFSCSRTNVRPTDAGTYSVVISNLVGSVTSAQAVLTVIRPVPRMQRIGLLPDQSILLEMSGGPGDFALEAAPGLSTWTTLTNLTAPGAVFQYIDPPSGESNRLYRLRALP